MTRCVRLVLLFALLLPATAVAGPVDLLESDVQAFVQDNGAMDVIYSLTFRDNEGRSFIRKVGPFYEPVHFTRAWLHGSGEKHKARVSPVGGGYYRVDFEKVRTRAGQNYTVELHYRCNHRFADPTSRGGEELLAVWFNPVRWVLPLKKSVVKLVLPLRLPKGKVKRHEDITPAMVDALGVLTDPGNESEHYKWAFVYTDYRGERRLTVYAEKHDLEAQGVHLVKLYIPAAAMPDLVAEDYEVHFTGGGWDYLGTTVEYLLYALICVPTQNRLARR